MTMIFVVLIAAIVVMIGGVRKVISSIFFMFLFCFSFYQILKVLIAKRTFSLQQKIMNLEQRNAILEDTARNLKTTLTHLVSEVGMLQVKYEVRKNRFTQIIFLCVVSKNGEVKM